MPAVPAEEAGSEGLAVEVTGLAQRRAWLDGVPPPVEEVRPGLWSVPVPMPGSPLRYVLVYALELPDGVALIDAGWDSDESWTALRQGLGQLGGDVRDVRAVLVTHVHPDHHGLAGRVRDASGAWIGMHADEAATLPRRYGDVSEILRSSVQWLRRLGAEEEEIDAASGSADEMAFVLRMVEPDRTIDDRERLPLAGWDLRAVWTPGHTPGHLCFHEERNGLLFTGDHVLPRITPNVSAQPGQLQDPLGDFLGTFDGLRALHVAEVLPAHEFRFARLADRLDSLVSHHAERLEELHGLLRDRPGSTAWQLAAVLTWSRPWPQVTRLMRRAAVGETLSHLRRLQTQGRARVELVPAAGGDVEHWSAAR